MWGVSYSLLDGHWANAGKCLLLLEVCMHRGFVKVAVEERLVGGRAFHSHGLAVCRWVVLQKISVYTRY